MILLKDVPSELSDRWLTWVDVRNNWMERAKQSKEMYYTDVDKTGTNYTKDQLAAINDLTTLPISINFQYPILQQKLAMLTATRPSIRVVSTDGKEEVAFLVDKIKHGIFLKSNSSTEIELATKESLITGMGGLDIDEPDFYIKGEFNTVVKYVRNEFIVLDPNARDKSLSDMEGYFISKMITLAKAKHLYSNIVSEVKDPAGNPVSWEQFTSYQRDNTWDEGVVSGTYSKNSEVVWVREYYEKVYSEAHYIEDPNGDIQIVFPEDIEEKNRAVLETAKRKEKGVYVRKSLILGDYIVAVKTLPVTEYTLNIIFFEWGGKPYDSYGMIHFTKSMQEAFDKMIQMFIANGILSNNAGWRAPKGSIAPDDKKQWEEHGANPFVIKEYVPQEVAGTVLVPEKEQVQSMSSFYPMILEMLKSSIQFSTGVSDVLSGDAKEAGVDTFSSLQQYQSAAMQRVMLSSKHINNTLEVLGRTLIEHIAAYIKPNQNYMFFDEDGKINEIKIAQEVANSIKLTSYKVTAIPATDSPTQRISVATELFKIAQTTPSPAERSLFTNKAIELLDIKETKELLAEADVVRNIEGKNAQLEEDLKRQTELNKQMENQVVQTTVDNKVLQELAKKTNSIAEQFGRIMTELKLNPKGDNNA